MSGLVDLFNAIEVVLWMGIAIMLLRSSARSPEHRRDLNITAALFAAFSLSDVVELQTGAFWRPWWLLAWKAACVFALLGMWRKSRRNKDQPPAN